MAYADLPTDVTLLTEHLQLPAGVDLSAYVLSGPVAETNPLFERSQRLTWAAAIGSGNYGKFIVHYDKIDLSARPPLIISVAFFATVMSKLDLLVKMSEHLQVKVEALDVVNDAIEVLEGTRFYLQAEANSVLWSGALQVSISG